MPLGTVSPGSPWPLLSTIRCAYRKVRAKHINIPHYVRAGEERESPQERCLQRIQTQVHDHTLFTSRESGEHSLVEGSGWLSVRASMYSSLLWTREMSISLSCNAQLETALGPCLPLCLSDYTAASKSQIGNTSQGSFRTTAFQRFLFPC